MKIQLTIDDPSVEGEDIIVESSSIRESIYQLRKIIGQDPREMAKVISNKKKESLEVFTHCVYGWDKVEGPNGKKSLTPNWEEQRVILMMKRWLEPHERQQKNLSFRQVADMLNQMGVKGKEGGKWSSKQIRRTLRYTIHDRIHEFDKPDWWE